MGCYPSRLTIKPQLLRVGRKPVTIQPRLPSHRPCPPCPIHTSVHVRAQLGLTWCRMNCSPPGSSCPWDSPGKNTGMGCHLHLQGISLTQGLNPCLLHLLHWPAGYHWHHSGSPKLLQNNELQSQASCREKVIFSIPSSPALRSLETLREDPGDGEGRKQQRKTCF